MERQIRGTKAIRRHLGVQDARVDSEFGIEDSVFAAEMNRVEEMAPGIFAGARIAADTEGLIGETRALTPSAGAPAEGVP